MCGLLSLGRGHTVQHCCMILLKLTLFMAAVLTLNLSEVLWCVKREFL